MMIGERRWLDGGSRDSTATFDTAVICMGSDTVRGRREVSRLRPDTSLLRDMHMSFRFRFSVPISLLFIMCRCTRIRNLSLRVCEMANLGYA